MIIRPDRARFWRPWRKRVPRLIVIVAGGAMATLVLVAIDWRPLSAFHLGWLVTIAEVLLSVLWVGVVFTLSALAVIAAALRVEQISFAEGRLRRVLAFGRRMEVPVESASVTRGKRADTVRAPAAKKPLLAPHVFYATEDLDRLWAAAGLTPADPAAS